MTTKRPLTKKKEKKGIHFIKGIVEDDNSIFIETDTADDMGIDGYIEFISNEEATSFLMAVQIKSGTSSVKRKSNGSYYIQADRDHFEYWQRYNVPVVLVAYSTEDKMARWLDATKYLNDRPEVIKNGPYNINVPDNQILNTDSSFLEFKKYFLDTYFEHYTGAQIFSKVLEDLTYFEDTNRLSSAIFALFNHRHKRATWFSLLNAFDKITNTDILKDLVYFISHITSHPDIWWSDKNTVNNTTREFARQMLNKTFEKDEFITLLNLIDENGIERGTIGQSIHEIIRIIDDYGVLLYSIAFDDKLDFEIQYTSLIILLSIYHEDLNRNKEILQKYISSYPSSMYNEILRNDIMKIVTEEGALVLY